MMRAAAASDEVRTPSLHSQIEGSAGRGVSPIVLLHGLGSRAEDWLFQQRALRDQWVTIALDLRGHGRSEPAREAFRIADLAEQVAATLVELGAPSVHLVGLSLGAAVSLQISLDRPGMVRSQTLVNGFARLRPRAGGLVAGVGRLLLAAVGPMDWLGWWVARTVFPGEEQEALRREAAARIAKNDRASYLRAMWAVARFDCRPRLAEVAAPSLVVAGTEDRVVPMAAKEELADGLPRGKLVRIEGSGHATPLDRPMTFNRTLVRFLEECENKSP